jgi:beta-propeller repeat-containing protein
MPALHFQSSFRVFRNGRNNNTNSNSNSNNNNNNNNKRKDSICMPLRHVNRRFALALVLSVIINMANIPAHFAAGSATTAGAVAAASSHRAEQPATAPDEETRARVSEAYGKLALSFEANQGQTAPQVKFISRGDGYNLFLTSNEAVLAMNKGAQGAALKIKLVGASPEPQVTGESALPGKSNYLLGADQSKWRTNIPNYARIKYAGVYPGIDLVYYGAGRQLEYDFIVAAGADPRQIRLSMEGAQEMRLDERGDLVLSVGGGEVRQRKPFVYQEVNGVKKEVAAQYMLSGKRQVGFSVAEYDKSKPLVIDPVLAYSTLLGGGGIDAARNIDVDADGFAYITGQTVSINFPTTAGAFQTAQGGGNFNDAFVAKLNQTGSALVYSTYLGGGNEDAANGITVRGRRAYVTGSTSSTNFPTTAGAFQTAFGGGQDAFVSELNQAGSALTYSTYLGGALIDTGLEIAVDSFGNAYVTGGAESLNFPVTTGAFQTTLGGRSDAFVTKFNPDGSALVYSTFLGGGIDDAGQGIDVRHGIAYVTGRTESLNFPTTAGAFQTAIGGSLDAFVTKLSHDGSALVYSTYLGGSRSDAGQDVAVDAFGKAHVIGQTSSSTNFPTTAGAFQTAFGGGFSDAFVTKLDENGSALVYSTFLGGSGIESGQSIVVRGGRAHVTGSSLSSNFPVTADATQATIGGGQDAFVTKLNHAGSALLFSTFLGGSGTDVSEGIAVRFGKIYVTGSSSSLNFPTTAGAFQTVNAGNSDGFVVKYD